MALSFCHLWTLFFLQLRGIVLTLSYHAWRHSWHDTIIAIKIRYVGVWVILMYENAHAQWRISWCIEYYYLLQWPAVTDDRDEMPLADIDTSDTHFRYNYNTAPIKFMYMWRKTFITLQNFNPFNYVYTIDLFYIL